MRKTMHFMLAAALAAISLAGPVAAQSPEEAIAAELGGLGIEADAVEVLPGEVRVTYEHPIASGAEDMIVACLRIMEAAAHAVPGAERLTVRVDFIGEPLLQVASSGADIRELAEGSLGPEAFAERLDWTVPDAEGTPAPEPAATVRPLLDPLDAGP